ncbi:MAG: LysM peptidoglycan-binding domain-containing protein [Carnobacterium sp.]|uniref:LysM peptidoglycan-binding domain-containing protein n=1 Tax=Carnobacterium sp. TaxID=48221 RepID=UPI002FC8BF8B
MAGKKSKNNQKDEIWSRKFDDEDGLANDEQSRIARKKAKGGISPILTSLFIFLALLIILPVATYLWYTNSGRADELKPAEDKITITQNSSTESSSEAKKSSSSSSEESSESVSSEESSIAETSVESEAVIEQEEPEQSTPEIIEEAPIEETPEVETPEVETPAETGNTYTVKAGDNLYRIALNHGMTTEELKALNGISGDEVSVGTVLKVN